MSEPALGKGIDRVDARLKVTGQALYADEMFLENVAMLENIAHAVIVTSPIAKGRIASIGVDAARRAPGVIEVLTHLNAPRLPGATKKVGVLDRTLQLLQDDRILYGDQPVAVAIADTLEHAQYAASAVVLETAAEAPISSLDDPRGRPYVPAPAGPVGEPDTSRGDALAAWSTSPVRVSATYVTPIQNHNPMEPHATIAAWQGRERLLVFDSTQGIFAVRRKLATLFDVPPEHVHVIDPYVGGAFGCKGSPWSHVALAAMAARVVRRPIKLVVTRSQMFSFVGHRPETRQEVMLAADPTGRLAAVRHRVLNETSSFDEFVEPSAVATRMLYACPNVETSHRLVRLDIGTPTFQRAPGEASGSFALESAMDELAYALHMDPLALRLKNYAERDPHENKPWSSKSLRACYERAAARFGWERRSAEPGTMRDGRWLVGYGMATATYPARQSASSAIARMRRDGTLLVQAGTQDIGTGTYTIMTQIAADALSMPVERVTFELGDTDFPRTPRSAGSQTASSTGSAVKMACLELRKRLERLSGREPLSHERYAELVGRSTGPEIVAEFKTDEKATRKDHSCHAFGADFVEVRVDADLGEVRVARIVAAFAAGKILNAKTARSQFIGGLVWGIGFALTERTVRDTRTARVVTRDLADYLVPVHADVPDMEVIVVEEHDPYVNEVGCKGIGEIGVTGISAAIANAVYHATGKRIRETPITPDKLV